MYAEANRIEEAERSFQEATRLNPQLPSALFNLATMKARKGEVDEAEALLRKARHAGSRNPDEIRREPFFKALIEGGRIDDLLQSSDRACLL